MTITFTLASCYQTIEIKMYTPIPVQIIPQKISAPFLRFLWTIVWSFESYDWSYRNPWNSIKKGPPAPSAVSSPLPRGAGSPPGFDLSEILLKAVASVQTWLSTYSCTSFFRQTPSLQLISRKSIQFRSYRLSSNNRPDLCSRLRTDDGQFLEFIETILKVIGSCASWNLENQ